MTRPGRARGARRRIDAKLGDVDVGLERGAAGRAGEGLRIAPAEPYAPLVALDRVDLGAPGDARDQRRASPASPDHDAEMNARRAPGRARRRGPPCRTMAPAAQSDPVIGQVAASLASRPSSRMTAHPSRPRRRSASGTRPVARGSIASSGSSTSRTRTVGDVTASARAPRRGPRRASATARGAPRGSSTPRTASLAAASRAASLRTAAARCQDVAHAHRLGQGRLEGTIAICRRTAGSPGAASSTRTTPDRGRARPATSASSRGPPSSGAPMTACDPAAHWRDRFESVSGRRRAATFSRAITRPPSRRPAGCRSRRGRAPRAATRPRRPSAPRRRGPRAARPTPATARPPAPPRGRRGST